MSDERHWAVDELEECAELKNIGGPKLRDVIGSLQQVVDDPDAEEADRAVAMSAVERLEQALVLGDVEFSLIGEVIFALETGWWAGMPKATETAASPDDDGNGNGNGTGGNGVPPLQEQNGDGDAGKDAGAPGNDNDDGRGQAGSLRSQERHGNERG